VFPKTIAILLVVLISSRSDGGKPQSAQDFLIDPHMPGVFVSFEKTVSGQRPIFQGESTKRIVLSLHNNYRFPIAVATFDLGEGQVGITYEISSTDQSSNAKVPRGYSEEVLTMQEVTSGSHLSFSVPANHLSGSLYLRIPFELGLESRATKGGAAPLHFAVFYGSLLPPSAER